MMALIVTLVLLLVLPSGDSPAAVSDEAHLKNRNLRVAMTFDDLPLAPRTASEECDPDEVLRLNRKLLDAINRQKMPATALVTGSRFCGADDDPVIREIFELWLRSGHELGNHSYSHRDLNTVSLDWYISDIVRGQAIFEQSVRKHAQTRRWFRPPLLHMGDDAAKKQGLERFLEDNQYSLAPVTIDNQEWVFAAVYDRAKADGDDELAGRVVESYVAHLEKNFEYYESLSEELLGRQIPQVLLLHANTLNADHLHRVAEMLRERGYELISLDDAVSDPAYDLEDSYIGSRGLSWLQRWALSQGITPEPEPREPEWIAEAFRRSR